MKKRNILALISLILVSVMLFSLTACTAAKAETVDLMDGITAKTVNGKDIDDTFKNAHISFSAELFKQSFDGENTLISPLSVMIALGMLGNGLEGESAEQLEDLFGGIESDELSKYLYTYVNRLPNGEKYSLDFANSVWMTDAEVYEVKESFLQALCDYYNAEAFKGDLQSEDVLDDINGWIEEKTDGTIEKILDEVDGTAVMLLINTLLFEADWAETYEEYQINDGVFTTENGEENKVSMMYSDESVYLEGDNVTGFMKPYANRKYSFAALLPNEGVTLAELVQSLDGEALASLISSRFDKVVHAAIPEFEYDFDIGMNDALKEMGLIAPFDTENSEDFVGIYADAAKHQFHISRVLHKTHIELTPVGTKAGAATVVEIADKAEDIMISDVKEVYLDRPFVYMIVDTDTNLPVFIGAVTDIGE